MQKTIAQFSYRTHSSYCTRRNNLDVLRQSGIISLSIDRPLCEQRVFAPLYFVLTFVAVLSAFYAHTTSLCAQSLVMSDAKHNYVQFTKNIKPLSQYVCSAWDTEKGLPSNVTISVLQTQDKYIWFGTNNGLVRFDGKTFRVFDTRTTPAIKNNRILNMFESLDRSLWICTNGGGLVRYANSQFSYYTTAEGIADDIVWNIFQDSHKILWLCTPSGLSCGVQQYSTVSDRQDTTYRFFKPILWRTSSHTEPMDIQPSLVFESSDGTIYVGTKNKGLFQLHRQSDSSYLATPCVLPGRDASFAIHDMEEDPQTHRIWVATERGLYTVSTSMLQSYNPTNDPRLNGLIFEVEYAPKQQQLWLGGNFGLLRYSDSVIVEMTQIEGVGKPEVNGLIIDHQGNTWCSTYRTGVFRLHNGILRSITQKESGLGGDVVYAVMETEPMSLWVGAYGGLTHISRTGLQVFRQAMSPQSDLMIRALCKTKEYGFLVGTYNQGVLRFDGKKFTPFLTATDMGSNVVRAITQDSYGDVWIASALGIIRLHAGKRTIYRQREELLPHNVLAFSEDSQRNFYICYDGSGIARFDRTLGTFNHADMMQGIDRSIVFSLKEDHAGILWAGTATGLYYYTRNSGWQNINEVHGLIDNSIFQFLEDTIGNVWLGTTKGMMRIAYTDLQALMAGQIRKLPVRAFGKNDGMVSATCNAPATALHASDGRIWMPTHNGVVIVEQIQQEPESFPQLYIEQISADSIIHLPSVYGDRVIYLPAGTQNIDIAFTGIEYSMPDQLEFRYMFEGIDTEWKMLGNRRVVYFNRLPAGEYRFKLAVTRHGSDRMQETMCTFVVLPYFYQTTWFYMLSFAVVCVIFWGILRYRVRNIQRQKYILEVQVAERTQQLQLRNIQLAHANHEIEEYAGVLEQKAQEISHANQDLQEKNERLTALNQEKNEFLGIVSHDLRNPLTAIMLSAESAKLKLGIVPINVGRVTHNVDQIMTHVEHMTTIVTNLLDINRIETQGLLPQIQMFDYGLLVADTCAGYLERASQKSISIHHTPEPHAIMITADPLLCREILHNLLSNAIKYSPPHTTVTISLRVQTSSVRLEVQDEGPGMTKDDKARLFGKFARLSAKPTGGEHSTGLGLSITKKMVEAMSGNIYCDSEFGKGTVFVVELPLPRTTA